MPVRKNDHPFLDHDGYIETGIPVEFYEGEFENAISEGRLAGKISADVARAIVSAWERAKVTPPDAREAVVKRIKEEFGLP